VRLTHVQVFDRDCRNPGAGLAQPDAGAFPVFVHEDHAGRFEGGADDGRRESGAAGFEPMTSLLTPAGRLDRRAIMIEAHRQFRLMPRHGWSFGRYLSFAWAKAREQRARTTAAPYISMVAA
jgi:hypothetical protein